MIIYTNCLGSFVFDDKLKLVDKQLFSVKEALKGEPSKAFLSRCKELRTPSEQELMQILAFFKSREYFPRFKEINTAITMEKVRASVNEDNQIISAVSSIEELERTANALTKRLREWYGLYFPELSEQVKDHEAFARLVFEKDKSALMKEINTRESMGADMELKPLKELAKAVYSLFEQKKQLEQYLEQVMENYCRNLKAVAGALIGAKLLKEAGSLKKMARVTSSTIQLFGAEKALFRHIRNKKAKPPKHGHIINHPLVASKADKGRAARLLADKLSLAAKVDYFKGEFIGDRLRKELEEKLK